MAKWIWSVHYVRRSPRLVCWKAMHPRSPVVLLRITGFLGTSGLNPQLFTQKAKETSTQNSR